MLQASVGMQEEMAKQSISCEIRSILMHLFSWFFFFKLILFR